MSDQTRTENAIELGKMYMLLDAANAREAALREELERATSRYDREVLGLNNEGDPIGGDPAGGYKNDNARLQKRLTVAEQRESLLKDLLTNSYIAINTMEPGFYLLEKIDAALRPAEEGGWIVNKDVERAITAVQDAKLMLNVAIGKAYPPETEVIAKLGGHLLHLKVRKTNPAYWDGSGDIYAENVKTGKRRTLRDSDVQEVLYKPELYGAGGATHDQ